jgi:hypothetical protein
MEGIVVIIKAARVGTVAAVEVRVAARVVTLTRATGKAIAAKTVGTPAAATALRLGRRVGTVSAATGQATSTAGTAGPGAVVAADVVGVNIKDIKSSKCKGLKPW